MPTYVSTGDTGSRFRSNLLLFFKGSGRDKLRADSFFLELVYLSLLRRLDEAIGNSAEAASLQETLRFLLVLSASIFLTSFVAAFGDLCIPRSAKAASCSALMLVGSACDCYASTRNWLLWFAATSSSSCRRAGCMWRVYNYVTDTW